MKILKTVQKIPGGLMAVPLFLAAAINTFFPSILQIGSFTTAFFSSAGAATLIGASLLCIGSQLRIKEAPEVIKRGTVLLVAKFIAGALLGIIIGKMFGYGGVLGISVLAIISSVSNGNGGLYMALMGEYGEPKDVAAQSILNINDGPFLTLVILGASGMANIPFMSLIAAIGPLIIGVILGNLDKDIRKFLAPGTVILIPMFAFSLGGGINLYNIVSAGFSGILLAFLVVGVSGFFLILADKLINKRPGYAGAAAASAAGNSVATPAAVASIDPSWAPYVESATAQVAAAVVLTAILVPLLTAYMAKKHGNAMSVLDESSNKDLSP